MVFHQRPNDIRNHVDAGLQVLTDARHSTPNLPNIVNRLST